MLNSLKMSPGTASRSLSSGDRLTKFIEGQRIKPFISIELAGMIRSPIKFASTRGGTAYGYEAAALADVCDAVLAAREAGAIRPHQQDHIAKQCEILVRGFAKVGIIALVDEATGYQEIRDREALQVILDRHLTDEWAKWTKTFPDEFYRHLFRLKGLPYPPHNLPKPSHVGHWTNDIVYSRLAPGVLSDLKKKNPVVPEKGRRERKHHEHFTRDFGHPALRDHLSNVIFLMRGCTTWADFQRLLSRAARKYGDNINLEMDLQDS